MKNKIIIILSITFLSINVSAMSFIEIVNNFNSHESIESMTRMALATEKGAEVESSWGDPMFKIAAKNFPVDSLDNDITPMTGMEIGVSQKIALTTKYSNIKDSLYSKSESIKFKAKNKKEALVKFLWEIVILKKKTLAEISIFKENLSWVNKILKVSKRLYANGKTSQQAILDIQIRKSEIESSLSNKKYEILQLEDKLLYLTRSESDQLDYSTIPWKVLTSKKENINDFKELALKEEVKSKEFNLSASKLNYVPDLTVAVSYTKRSNIDSNGDFVGATISFPLPFSGKKYASQSKAVEEKYSVVKSLEDYKRQKTKNSSILTRELKKLQAEIIILTNKTIKYANNSRIITSKSYGFGNSTYVELLQSELKLQRILLKKVMLVAKRDIKKITLKYILGESLYE